MAENRQTIQMPQRNPLLDVLFNSLDIIPQQAQRDILSAQDRGEQLRDSLIQSIVNPVDLGKITVSGPRPDGGGESVTTVSNQQPVAAPPPIQPKQDTQDTNTQDFAEGQKQGGIIPDSVKKFLSENKDIILPALVAGLGSAVPAALPGAAGFNQGFGQEKFRQREVEDELNLDNIGEDEVAIIDPENPEAKPQIIKIPKGARILKKGGEAVSEGEFNSLIRREIKSTEDISEGVKEKYIKGEVIKKDGRKFKVTGFDKDGEPLVDEIINGN